MSTPYTLPLGYNIGFRLSVATSSWINPRGVDHPHCVSTTLRSTPAGRGGSSGTSPAMIRSVQPAYIWTARSWPMRSSPLVMLAPLPPICTRLFHASCVES